MSALALVAALGSTSHPFHVAPAVGALEPLSLVECPSLAVTLPAGRCADRHLARWPSGDRRGKPQFPTCAGCALGAAYRARLEGYTQRPDSQAPEVMSNAQRAARLRWNLSRLPFDEEGRDPMREAATLTPDDRGFATSGA